MRAVGSLGWRSTISEPSDRSSSCQVIGIQMKRTVPLLLLLAAPAIGQEPILDMHLHAMGANDQGPAPIAICAPFATFRHGISGRAIPRSS